MGQRALPSAVEYLQSAIASLEITLYSLQSQLNPILDSPTCLKDSCGDVKGTVAPLHYSTQINDVVGRIRELNSLGTDLMSRLHV